MLFLGDSFTEALQVPVDDGFVSLIGRRLGVEAINAGVSGTGVVYQTDLYRAFFEERVRVDHVVVALFPPNELEDNSFELGPPLRNRVYLAPKGGTFLYSPSVSWTQQAALAATNVSALANFAYAGLYRLRRVRMHEAVAQASAKVPKKIRNPEHACSTCSC